MRCCESSVAWRSADANAWSTSWSASLSASCANSFSSAVTARGARACAVCHGFTSTMVFFPTEVLGLFFAFRNERFPIASRVVHVNTRHTASSAKRTRRMTSRVLPSTRVRSLCPAEKAIGGTAMTPFCRKLRPQSPSFSHVSNRTYTRAGLREENSQVRMQAFSGILVAALICALSTRYAGFAAEPAHAQFSFQSPPPETRVDINAASLEQLLKIP